MSKADRDRQALLQRLAREQRRALDAAARDADRARTPRTAPTPRRDDSPPSRTSAQSAARLKSLTPLYKQRQQRRLTVLIAIIIVLALALTVVTGTLSASLALLGEPWTAHRST